MTVEAAVGSAPELLSAVERLHPAAVLTDIRMPAGPGNGIQGELGLSSEQQSHRRVTAVLAFLRDAGLRS